MGSVLAAVGIVLFLGGLIGLITMNVQDKRRRRRERLDDERQRRRALHDVINEPE